MKKFRLNFLSVFFCVLTFSLSGLSAQAETSESLSRYKNVREVRLSQGLEDLSVFEIFRKIESETPFRFNFFKKELDLKARYSVKDENPTVADVLLEISKISDLRFRQVNHNIHVSKAKKDSAVEKVEVVIEGVKVTGTVRDETGEPVLGATVLVKGAGRGTVTDVEGRYTLVVEAGETLIFRAVGFETQELEFDGNQVLDITLSADVKELAEIVVVGYGTVKKSDLTASITSVSVKEVPKAATASIENMLQGQAAGLQVSPSGFEPGKGSSMQIRGAASLKGGNEPLWVVDGFPLSSSPGNSLNPNDIKSIEILKDASATSIYGARAANGVILVTTLSGEAGKTSVSYNGKYTMQDLGRVPEMMDAQTYMRERNRMGYELWMQKNKIGVYGGNDAGSFTPFVPKYTDEQINSFSGGTDWLDEVTRTGVIQEHNISIRGGNEKTTFLTSLNYFENKGVVDKSSYERVNLRLNLDHKVSDWVKVGLKSNGTFNKEKKIKISNGTTEGAGVISSALTYNPTLSIFDEKGAYTVDPDASFLPNPVSLLEIADNNEWMNITAMAYADVKLPIEGLSMRANAGIEYRNFTGRYYIPTSTSEGQKKNGYASWGHNRRLSKLFDFTLNYNKDIMEGHSLSAMAGYSYQDFDEMKFNANNSNFVHDGTKEWDLGSGTADRPGVGSGGSENKYVSAFARVNYNALDRYLFTFTMRADGSSKFGSGNKFGYFPSAAFAWKIANENFMEGVEPISDLKLRLSYGQVGNSGINQDYRELYTFNRTYVFGGNFSKGASLKQVENPDLKWETTTELNIGVDFGLFENRITGSVEVFDKEISDLLSERKLLAWSEKDKVLDNIGSTQSRGVELSLSSINVTNDKFEWRLTFNIATYRDRWKERSPDWNPSIYQSEDDPIRTLYTKKSDGLVVPGREYPHMEGAFPGLIYVQDLNGDGKLDDLDVVVEGSKDPKFQAGFGNYFQYGAFDLAVFMYGKFNYWRENKVDKVFNGNAVEFWKQSQNKSEDFGDRWTHDNQNTDMPSGIKSPYGTGDFYWEKISFVRIQNITLGYTVPTKKLEQVRVFADVRNPFVFTNYEGLDPEFDGVGAYPSQRSFTLGLDIKF
ncbi:SusC/RagA family TonB-linked outer membrane protein [Fulvitalea axinellae]|uniref:SusC/RagA family TonB-linked outer membrane protein n=1 Tax=Fulvitalea axinellae TaxID=1182444 RepID=A0AAU9CVJ1_9BACT|nr:SusC/RagA family TonB-linked outer membrane protein [Fulvitalea axinellae]